VKLILTWVTQEAKSVRREVEEAAMKGRTCSFLEDLSLRGHFDPYDNDLDTETNARSL
jgi:hypothetical protein